MGDQPDRWLLNLWKRLLHDDINGRLTSHCGMDEAMDESSRFAVWLQCENLLHEGRWFAFLTPKDRETAQTLVAKWEKRNETA